ncbi:MAG: Crp/Fnr family transcriptional regulator [Roseiflexaceae bacterium]
MQELTQIPLFQGLTAAEFASLRAMARIRRIPRSHYLFFEHEPATHLYVLMSGWMRLVKVAHDGRQSLIRLVGPGDVVGISAIMQEQRYRLIAQATSLSFVLVWDHQSVLYMLKHHPIIHENALRVISQHLADLEQQYVELATERVEQRIAHTLMRIIDRYGHVEQNQLQLDVGFSQHDLADLVGVTHYTISRVLSAWRSQQILDFQRGQLMVFDLIRLCQKAELLTDTDSTP